MSIRKFGQNDVLLNTMRTYPPVKFFIYGGQIYFNDSPPHSGSLSDNVLSVTGGGISLYEYNVDRQADQSELIYPFITKDSAGASFRTAGRTTVSNEFQYGDQINGKYPLTASISRKFMSHPASRQTGSSVGYGDGTVTFNGPPFHRHYYALKNTLDSYSWMSPHYTVASTIGDGWNKGTSALNLISIPSIFYGSKIKKGTVSLKWYITGTLAAELRDTRQNGELHQVAGTTEAMAMAATRDEAIAGTILYNEGFIVLTGSWGLSTTKMQLVPGAAHVSASWLYFGAGAQDGCNESTCGESFTSSSFEINFEGQTDIQVYTMFAKANRGEANYSNNPTFLKQGQAMVEESSKKTYRENSNRKIKNIASSSFGGYSAEFKRQVVISRIGVYDKDKNLLGIATLADPVVKEEDGDYTFKIKLDI